MARGYPRRSGRRHPTHALPVRSLPPPHPPRRARAPGVVDGGLEDDQHYFTVTLHHDEHAGGVGRRAGRCARRGRRAPTPRAPLRALAGMPLSDRCLAVTEWTELDAALHPPARPRRARGRARGARRRGAGQPVRQYDAEIPFGLLDGEEHTVTLARDGHALLRWSVQGVDDRRAEPVRGRDRRLRPVGRRDPRRRRRRGRRRAPTCVQHRDEPWPRPRRATPPWPTCPASARSASRCSPQVAPVAFRNRGLIRDYDDRPDAMLADGPLRPGRSERADRPRPRTPRASRAERSRRTRRRSARPRVPAWRRSGRSSRRAHPRPADW